MTVQPPRSAYLVCASQRSGSTLLVESLALTGQAGNPKEYFQYLPHSGLSLRPREWFAAVSDPSVLDLLAPLDRGHPDRRTAAEWADTIRVSGQSDNGIWGGKLMWNHTSNVLARAAGLPRPRSPDLWSTLVEIIGTEPILIHVSRSDVVAQAVSMWRALQTQVWRGPTDPQADARARYHPLGVAHLVRVLRTQQVGWAAWFEELAANRGVEPTRIEYGELAADSTAVTARVLTRIGIDADLAPKPPLRKQGDQRSLEWIAQYRADAERMQLPI